MRAFSSYVSPASSGQSLASSASSSQSGNAARSSASLCRFCEARSAFTGAGRPAESPGSTAATASRRSTFQWPRDAALLARSIRRVLLDAFELLDAGGCEVEQLVQPAAFERNALGGRLHLDETALAGHDHVHVDVGARVLLVVEVEQRLAAEDADRDGRDRTRQDLREREPVERAVGGDVGAADGCAASPAVGLEHVAVEVDGAFAERL